MTSDDYLANLIGVFATTISTLIEREISEVGGRSISHNSALVTIRNHPNDTIDMLSKVLGITHSGAVRLVDTLESEGRVERHRSGDDGRAVVLRLTAKGRSEANKVLRARGRVTKAFFEKLTAEQRAVLAPMLETALESFTDGHESARRICRLCDEGACRPQGCPVEIATTNESV
jgi:DNA-binding MarR family transcriptional regulator